MTEHRLSLEVTGPWSLATSRTFWEGFAPAALPSHGDGESHDDPTLTTVFRVDADWSRAAVGVTQRGPVADLVVEGDGDLDAAAGQVARFLASTSTPAAGPRWPTATR